MAPSLAVYLLLKEGWPDVSSVRIELGRCRNSVSQGRIYHKLHHLLQRQQNLPDQLHHLLQKQQALPDQLHHLQQKLEAHEATYKLLLQEMLRASHSGATERTPVKTKEVNNSWKSADGVSTSPPPSVDDSGESQGHDALRVTNSYVKKMTFAASTVHNSNINRTLPTDVPAVYIDPSRVKKSIQLGNKILAQNSRLRKFSYKVFPSYRSSMGQSTHFSSLPLSLSQSSLKDPSSSLLFLSLTSIPESLPRSPKTQLDGDHKHFTWHNRQPTETSPKQSFNEEKITSPFNSFPRPVPVKYWRQNIKLKPYNKYPHQKTHSVSTLNRPEELVSRRSARDVRKSDDDSSISSRNPSHQYLTSHPLQQSAVTIRVPYVPLVSVTRQSPHYGSLNQTENSTNEYVEEAKPNGKLKSKKEKHKKDDTQWTSKFYRKLLNQRLNDETSNSSAPLPPESLSEEYVRLLERQLRDMRARVKNCRSCLSRTERRQATCGGGEGWRHHRRQEKEKKKKLRQQRRTARGNSEREAQHPFEKAEGKEEMYSANHLRSMPAGASDVMPTITPHEARENRRVSTDFRRGFNQKIVRMDEALQQFSETQSAFCRELRDNLGARLEKRGMELGALSEQVAALVRGTTKQLNMLEMLTSDQVYSGQQGIERRLAELLTLKESQVRFLKGYHADTLLPALITLSRILSDQASALTAFSGETLTKLEQLHAALVSHSSRQADDLQQLGEEAAAFAPQQVERAAQGRDIAGRLQSGAEAFVREIQSRLNNVVQELVVVRAQSQTFSSLSSHSVANLTASLNESESSALGLDVRLRQRTGAWQVRQAEYRKKMTDQALRLQDGVKAGVSEALSAQEQALLQAGEVEVDGRRFASAAAAAWVEHYNTEEHRLRLDADALATGLRSHTLHTQNILEGLNSAAQTHEQVLEQQRADFSRFVHRRQEALESQCLAITDWSALMSSELRRRDLDLHRFLSDNLHYSHAVLPALPDDGQLFLLYHSASTPSSATATAPSPATTAASVPHNASTATAAPVPHNASTATAAPVHHNASTATAAPVPHNSFTATAAAHGARLEAFVQTEGSSTSTPFPAPFTSLRGGNHSIFPSEPEEPEDAIFSFTVPPASTTSSNSELTVTTASAMTERIVGSSSTPDEALRGDLELVTEEVIEDLSNFYINNDEKPYSQSEDKESEEDLLVLSNTNQQKDRAKDQHINKIDRQIASQAEYKQNFESGMESQAEPDVDGSITLNTNGSSCTNDTVLAGLEGEAEEDDEGFVKLRSILHAAEKSILDFQNDIQVTNVLQRIEEEDLHKGKTSWLRPHGRFQTGFWEGIGSTRDNSSLFSDDVLFKGKAYRGVWTPKTDDNFTENKQRFFAPKSDERIFPSRKRGTKTFRQNKRNSKHITDED